MRIFAEITELLKMVMQTSEWTALRVGELHDQNVELTYVSPGCMVRWVTTMNPGSQLVCLDAVRDRSDRWTGDLKVMVNGFVYTVPFERLTVTNGQ